MMRARSAAWIALALGCGRIGFGAAPDAGDGAGDGGPDGDGPMVACGSGHLRCDGFEGTTLDPRWIANGDVALDAAFAHRGAQSVRVRVPALNANQAAVARIQDVTVLASGPTQFWTRAWFRIGALPAPSNAMEILSAEQTASPQEGDYVLVHATDLRLFDQFDGRTAGAGSPPPAGTWFCAIWRLVLATNNTGVSELTTDVLMPVALVNSVTNSTPRVDLLGIGIYFAAPNVNVAQPSLSLWIDDVIVDTAPVSCTD